MVDNNKANNFAIKIVKDYFREYLYGDSVFLI